MSDVVTSHHPEKNRYEAHLDGELAGFAEYQLTDALVIFTHTEVDPKFEGKGVGSALARFALDDVRAAGTRRVLPLCPFIKGWIAKHPEYEALVHGLPNSTATDGSSSTGECTGSPCLCTQRGSECTDCPVCLGVSAPLLSLSGGGPRVATSRPQVAVSTSRGRIAG